MHTLLILQSVVAGALMPAQAGINALLHREVGHPIGAAFVSFFVGTLALMALYAVFSGQMIASVVLDHFGLLGFTEQPLSLPRALGVAFLIAGVFLIRRT